MSLAPETSLRQTAPAALGGLVDAIGGVATAVLAICGLVGVDPPVIMAAATIVFGAALLLQGGACAADYAQIARAGGRPAEIEPGGAVAAVLLIGAAGLVLGVLALLGVDAGAMVPAAVVAFGAAMILGADILPQLHALRCAATAPARRFASREAVVSQIASGAAVVQSLSGLAAIVLGVLALAGLDHPALVLTALLELGVTLVVTGGALTATFFAVGRG